MSPAKDIWRIHVFLNNLLFKLIVFSLLATSKIVIILIVSVPIWRWTWNTKIVIWGFKIQYAFKFFGIFQAFFVIFKFIMFLFDWGFRKRIKRRWRAVNKALLKFVFCSSIKRKWGRTCKAFLIKSCCLRMILVLVIDINRLLYLVWYCLGWNLNSFKLIIQIFIS